LVIVRGVLDSRQSFRTKILKESKRKHTEMNRDWNKYCTGLPRRDQV